MTAAQDLQDLAKELVGKDDATASKLQDLASALDPDADPGGWLGVVPSQVIDVESVVSALVLGEGDGAASRAGRFEVVRNVLILMPIVLTWAGMFYAALGYQTVIARQPDLASEPFLLLWEQQFRGLLGPPLSYFGLLRLSNVAIVDVCLLLVVGVLTAFIQREVSVRQHWRQVQQRTLTARLTNALGSAHLELTRRSMLPALVDSFQRTATALTAELKAEREHLIRISDDRERDRAAMRSVTQDFKVGAVDMVRAAADYSAVASQLDRTVGAIRAEVEHSTAATDQLVSAIKVQLTELTHNHEVATGNAAAVGGLAKAMIQTLEQVLPSVATLTTITKEVQSSTIGLLEAMAEDVKGREAATAAMQEASAGLATAVGAANASLTASVAASTEIAAAMQEIRAAATTADDLSKSMDRLSTGLATVQGNLVAEGELLNQAVENFRQAADVFSRSARASADTRPPAGPG